MHRLYLLTFATSLLAQTVTLPGGVIGSPFILEQTFTTGMVGFATNQTARLNVLNLNSTTSTTTQDANCTVALQFLDAKGNSVKQTAVPNFAAGAATSLDLTRAALTSDTAIHAEIRGVVTVNPLPAPEGTPAAVGNCAVMTTLEIFDSTSGSTVTFTSDTRPVGPGIVVGILGTPR